MRLRLKIAIGIMLLMVSVCELVPNVGAMRAAKPFGQPCFSRKTSLIQRIPYLPHELSAEQESLIRGIWLNRREDVKKILKGREVPFINGSCDERGNTIWHILVAIQDWDFIKHILGTIKDPALDSETIAICRESFMEGSIRENMTGYTPIDFARASQTLDDLKKCIPIDMLCSYQWRNLPEELQ